MLIGLMLGSAGASTATPESELPQQFEGFNLKGYKDGDTVAWDVNGDNADIVGNTVTITNVVANMYGEQNTNLTAKTGTMDKVSGNMHLEEDVVITSEMGVQLTTDTLDWQRNQDLVSTDDRVVITKDDMFAVGTGMTAHPNLKQAQLNEDVTVKLRTEPQSPKGGQVVTITCDGPMEIDQVQNIAIFNDNVVAIQEGGRELKADKLELYVNPETNQMDKMICTGHVIITQGENKSFSDKAVYYGATQKIVLSGNPKLVMITEGEGSIASLSEKEKKKDESEEKSESSVTDAVEGAPIGETTNAQ